MATTTTPVVNGAYVHLFTNETYLPGLLVLHRSYVKVGSSYPFVVMVTPSVSSEVRQILQETGMVVRAVAPVKPPQEFRLEKGDSRFMDTWTKLRCVNPPPRHDGFASGMSLELTRFVIMHTALLNCSSTRQVNRPINSHVARSSISPTTKK
jgi:hypothetical protein